MRIRIQTTIECGPDADPDQKHRPKLKKMLTVWKKIMFTNTGRKKYFLT
jgi:hypothetical protein